MNDEPVRRAKGRSQEAQSLPLGLRLFAHTLLVLLWLGACQSVDGRDGFVDALGDDRGEPLGVWEGTVTFEYESEDRQRKDTFNFGDVPWDGKLYLVNAEWEGCTGFDEGESCVTGRAKCSFTGGVGSKAGHYAFRCHDSGDSAGNGDPPCQALGEEEVCAMQYSIQTEGSGCGDGDHEASDEDVYCAAVTDFTVQPDGREISSFTGVEEITELDSFRSARWALDKV